MDRFGAAQLFIRITELGSFAAASKDLNLRPAKASRWIRQLEDELGAQLLERTTRALRPTDAGLRFMDEARVAVDAWSRASSAVRDQQQLVAGRIRMSAPVVFGERFIAKRLPEFVARHPKLELDLRYSDRYVDLVSEGFDLAVRVGQRVDSEYRSRTLGRTPRRLVAAPEFVATCAALRHPRDLENAPCLLHSGLNNRAAWSFVKHGRRTRVSVKGRLHSNHSDTLFELAKAGQGVALLASWLVDDAIAAGELVGLLTDFEAPPATIHAVHAADRHVSSALAATLDFVAEAVAPALSAS